MESSSINLINFSVNNWHHLYSLEQAIQKQQQATGSTLTIQGTIRNAELLANQDTGVEISFKKVTGIPEYESTPTQSIILGEINRQDNKLNCTLLVDETVFEELRKNLMEYADIDGIHIVVTLGILINKPWPVNTKAKLVKLDYAMKGDA
ncbi:MAG: hypothetical protein OEY87_10765 [Gammaproteobacteria bacterium]|nr:hypothetical protein [Gammaproteobacteria bacterium]MDH5736592.1 hypothetical protein [Gammaproteobacteria bacterium]